MKTFNLIALAIFLIQTGASAQDFQWVASFGGTGDDVVRAMAVDDLGNTYTTGYYTETCDFDPGSEELLITSNGFFDIFVQKLDTDGNLLWVKTFGGDFFDYGTGIEVDLNGNVLVTGVYQETVDFDSDGTGFELTSAGGEDIFALKLDEDGNFIWAGSMGSNSYEEPTSIGSDSNGNIYVSGYFSEAGDYDPGEGVFTLTSNGGQDAFVVSLDSEGNFNWARNIGGPEQELSLGMDVNSFGDVFLTGNFSLTVDFDPGEGVTELTADDSDAYILKLNALGEFVYVATFGGNGSDIAWDIALDADGNAFAAGSFSQTFTAGDDTYTSSGGEDVFAVKVNPFGGIEWGAALGGSSFQNAYDINTDIFGNVLLAGFFNGPMDFDPSPDAEFELSSESSEPFDAFYAVLNTDGQFVSAGNFSGSDFTEHHGIDSDAEGNIYLAAAYQGAPDVNPSPDENEIIVSAGFRDNYVIKLSPATTAVADSELPQISIYPNPATDILIPSLQSENQLKFQIFDVTGKTIQRGLINSNQQIPVQDLETGVYLLEIEGYAPVKWVKL